MRHLPVAMALIALALFPRPAQADAPLSADAFAAEVTGQTITWRQMSEVFGIEEYLPDRSVRWSVAPGMCLYGSWYQQGEAICFVYEDDPLPHCWTFRLVNGALVARSADAGPDPDPALDLHEAGRSTTPLPCPGPDVGV